MSELPPASPRFVKQQRDPETARTTLTRWLSGRLDTPVEVVDLETPSGAGVSNETFLFRARWEEDGQRIDRELVLRLHPSADYQVFFDPEFRTQYDLWRIWRTSPIRVPRVYWYEDDPGPFGRPFFVMERIHGDVPVSMPLYTREGFLFRRHARAAPPGVGRRDRSSWPPSTASPSPRWRSWTGRVGRLPLDAAAQLLGTRGRMGAGRGTTRPSSTR